MKEGQIKMDVITVKSLKEAIENQYPKVVEGLPVIVKDSQGNLHSVTKAYLYQNALILEIKE